MPSDAGSSNPRSSSTPAATPVVPAPTGCRFRRAVLYPDAYAWYVLFAALDLMLTWVILLLDGRELNLLANWIISCFDLVGLVVFKFALVLFVVLVCEIAGRRNRRVGHLLARGAIAVTALPVAVALFHLVSAWIEDAVG